MRAVLPAILLLQGAAHAGGGTGPLHINPFVRPEMAPTVGGKASSVDGVSMELRGVMLAGDHSLANIGGRVVGIGEDINGYRLITVSEYNAVLEREGVRRELVLKTQDGSSGDGYANGSW